jgi:hypothetical protein
MKRSEARLPVFIPLMPRPEIEVVRIDDPPVESEVERALRRAVESLDVIRGMTYDAAVQDEALKTLEEIRPLVIGARRHHKI